MIPMIHKEWKKWKNSREWSKGTTHLDQNFCCSCSSSRLQVTAELSLVIRQSGLCALPSIERESEYQAYTKSKPNQTQTRPDQTRLIRSPNQTRTRPNQTKPSRIPCAPIPKRNAAPSAGGPRQEEHHLHANSPQTNANTQGRHKPHPRNPRKPEGARNHARTWAIEVGITIFGKGATLNPNAFSRLSPFPEACTPSLNLPGF
jgi:hypothetical protein